MPKPPGDIGFFDKVNYVIDAWARPCEAPWYIYVECLKPAALNAFITFITFGLADVARGFARPKGLNKRRSGKRKGKWNRRVPRFPELGNLLGSHLPGSDAARSANWSDGAKSLWRIDGVAQHFLFWWLVADITNDFAFEFTSCLYETRWCKESSAGRFSFQLGPAQQALPDVWGAVGYNDKDYQFPFPSWIITFGNTGLKGATITFSMDIEPFFPSSPPVAYETRLRNFNSSTVYASSGPTDADPDGKGIAVVSGSVPAQTQFVVEIFPHGGRAKITDGVVVGMEDLI